MRQFFDSRAERWDETAIHPPDRIARVLEAAGPLSGLSILDVGTGSGVLLERLLEGAGSRGRVVALDISPGMIEVARGKRSAPNLGFVVADFIDWESEASFDVVIAYSCFPHFRDRGAFFHAAARNLRPGGLVLVAHIEGRKAINAMHGKNARNLSLPLPPVEEIGLIAGEAGFEPRFARDDPEYWIYSGMRAWPSAEIELPSLTGFSVPIDHPARLRRLPDPTPASDNPLLPRS